MRREKEGRLHEGSGGRQRRRGCAMWRGGMVWWDGSVGVDRWELERGEGRAPHLRRLGDKHTPIPSLPPARPLLAWLIYVVKVCVVGMQEFVVSHEGWDKKRTLVPSYRLPSTCAFCYSYRIVSMTMMMAMTTRRRNFFFFFTALQSVSLSLFPPFTLSLISLFHSLSLSFSLFFSLSFPFTSASTIQFSIRPNIQF